jgi:hypothetical protein
MFSTPVIVAGAVAPPVLVDTVNVSESSDDVSTRTSPAVNVACVAVTESLVLVKTDVSTSEVAAKAAL